MTAQETGTANWYSTVLSAPMGATDTSASVDSIVGVPDRPCYLVVEPDNASQREVMLFTGLAGSTFTGATVATNRYLAGSAAGSGLSHPAGSVVECRPIAQLFTDLNDRVDGSVAKTLYDANSVVIAVADNTPVALAFAASRIFARLASGDIVAATPAQIGDLVFPELVAGDIPDLSATYLTKAAPDGATVATDESTTSATYTDLATAGPAVTITTGTRALVIVSARARNATLGSFAYAAFAVSGATTRAAGDDDSFAVEAGTASQRIAGSRATLVTGLTAGSNTFTMKYRAGGGTAAFDRRHIVVIPL